MSTKAYLQKIVIPIFLLFITGCAAPTRPNVSVIYQIPALRTKLPPPPAEGKSANTANFPREVEALFQELYGLDSSLALEVGRLPDFQEKPGEPQVQALTRFISLMKGITVEERRSLGRLMKIGRPEVRRYCAPLQSIFWILEKREEMPGESSLVCKGEICLQSLLDQSWEFSDEDRWKDYNVVTDRLNAPELIDYYEKRRFFYVFRADHIGNSRVVFKTDRGQCADVTAFTVDCLTKGGYEGWDHHVASPSGYSYHHVTRFVMDGKHYIMDNGRPDKRGIVPAEIYSPY